MPSRIAPGVLGVDKETFFRGYVTQLWAFLGVVILALVWALGGLELERRTLTHRRSMGSHTGPKTQQKVDRSSTG